MMLSWKFPPAALSVRHPSLPMTRAHTCIMLSHMHRVDLAGHDRAARLTVRQLDLIERRTAGREPSQRMLFDDVEERRGDRLQLAMALDETVPLGVPFEVIHRFDERRFRSSPATDSGNAVAELRMRVDPRCPQPLPPTGELQDRLESPFGPFNRKRELPGEAAELLAEPERRARPRGGSRPILMILSHSLAFAAKGHPRTVSSAGISVFRMLTRDGDVDCRREGVVGALPHVDVVVGVDRLVLGEAVAAEDLDRPVGDDFVGVHVARRPRSGLEDVDREFAVELAGGDFLGGGSAWRRSASC